MARGSEQQMKPAEVYRQLQTKIGPDAMLDEPMWRHTSFRVGGPVDLFVRVQSSGSLAQLVPAIADMGVPWRVLGGGTNVLVSDAGFRGCILALDGDKPDLELLDERTGPSGEAQVVVRVQAGCKLILAARKAVEQGLGGLEWAVGLPGTVGGAVVNNAGAHGADIASIFETATAVDASGTLIRLGPDDMAYSYRSSAFKRSQRPHLVLMSSELRLTRAAREKLMETAARFENTRKQHQPPGLSAGSIFKNPLSDFAGRLVETAGLKGLKVGGAQVSPIHGNFFLNSGSATAADLYQLARAVQDGVWARHGIWLEPEVELLGEWTDGERQSFVKPAVASQEPADRDHRDA
jgi:UDP-N-acetylmuramate dehydrogenase